MMLNKKTLTEELPDIKLKLELLKKEETTTIIEDDMIEPLILKHLQLLKDGNNPDFLRKTTKLLNESGICGNALKEKVIELTPFIDRDMWSCTKEQIREFSSIYDKADQISQLLGENSDLSKLSDLLSNEVQLVADAKEARTQEAAVLDAKEEKEDEHLPCTSLHPLSAKRLEEMFCGISTSVSARSQ